MLREGVDEFAADAGDAALGRVERGEFEMDARLEGAHGDAARRIFLRGEGVDQRQADAGRHQGAGDLAERRLDPLDARDAAVGEQAVDAVAQQGEGAERHEGLPLEILRPQPLARGEPVALRHHGHHRNGRHAFERHRRMLDRHGGEAQVALAARDPVEHDVRDEAVEREVELRPVGEEAADEARQEPVGERRQGRDP